MHIERVSPILRAKCLLIGSTGNMTQRFRIAACRWLAKLVFSQMQASEKGIFDGHEQTDVVA